MLGQFDIEDDNNIDLPPLPEVEPELLADEEPSLSLPIEEGDDEEAIEAEARKQGWRPGGKRNAREFLEYGRQLAKNRQDAPIRERDEKIAQLEKQMAAMQKGFEVSMTLAQAQHKRELDEKLRQRRDAIELGDVEEVERLDKEIEDHKALTPSAKEEEPPVDPREQQRRALMNEYRAAPQDVKQWMKENPWFSPYDGETGEPNPQFNVTMTRYAAQYAQDLQRNNPALNDSAIVRMVGKEIRKRFPENFEHEEDPMKQMYSGTPSRTGSTATTPKTNRASQASFDSLPNSAKAQYNSFVKKGMIKDSAESRADYARMYNE